MPRGRPPKDACFRSEAPWTQRRQHTQCAGTRVTVTDLPFEQSSTLEDILKKGEKLARELTVRAGDEDVATVQGLAALVVSDSESGFSAAGYFLEAANRGCWAVSVKVMVPRVDCQQEASWGILLVQLHSHKRSVTIGAMAERHGTDAISLSPVDPSSHQFLCAGAAPHATPQAHFQCTMLKGHTAAPTALPSWCRSLVTSDRDVVNLGLMSISAVPLRLLRR